MEAGAQLWDTSTVASLDAIEHRYAARGKRAHIVGMDRHSAARHGALTGQPGGG